MKAHMEDLVGGIFDAPAALIWMEKPETGTASWYWTGASHEVRVYPDLLNMATADKPKNLPLFVKTVKKHENAHAVFTARKGICDKKAVLAAKKGVYRKRRIQMTDLVAHNNTIGCPHALHNVGEDCWIEHQYKLRFHQRWQWTKWVKLSYKPDFADAVPDEHAVNILLDIKQFDGVRVDIMRYLGIKSLTKIKTLLSSTPEQMKRVFVWNYYHELKYATDSWEVANIMRRFIAEFPEARSYDKKGDMNGNYSNPKDGPDTVGSQTQKGEAKTVEKAVFENGRMRGRNLMSTGQGYWTPGCGNTVAEVLRDAITAGPVDIVPTDQPTDEIDVEDWISRQPEPYRQSIKGNDGRGQQVVVIFDVSSSMRGDYHQNGIRLLDGLKTLSDSGDIKLAIFFACAYGCDRWDGGGFSHADLDRLKPNGGSPLGEGFKRADKDGMIDPANVVICYTDGAIQPGDMTKRTFLARGVHSLGCFVGPLERCNNDLMKATFGRVAVRSSVGSLASWLAEEILNTKEAQSINDQ